MSETRNGQSLAVVTKEYLVQGKFALLEDLKGSRSNVIGDYLDSTITNQMFITKKRYSILIYLLSYCLLNALPITIRLISLVPAPISYNFASRRSRPAGISLT